MAVGIRAYQWGWEYYYPKDIDLGYRVGAANQSYLGSTLSLSEFDEDSVDSNKYFEFIKDSSSLTNSSLLPSITESSFTEYSVLAVSYTHLTLPTILLV